MPKYPRHNAKNRAYQFSDLSFETSSKLLILNANIFYLNHYLDLQPKRVM